MSRDELGIADAGDRDATWHARGRGDGRQGISHRTHVDNVRYLYYTLHVNVSFLSPLFVAHSIPLSQSYYGCWNVSKFQ